jgi:hypothetical protein
MPSKLRSETARTNGAKSRGPTTPAGLEKSSQNAVTHGLTSESTIVLACESQSRFDGILNEFMVTHQPANAAETDLVEEMVAARWRIRRMWNIETTLMNDEIANQESQSMTDAGNRRYLARAFRTLSDDSRSLALAQRYQTRLHRIFNEAYATLRDLQKIRESKPPANPPQRTTHSPVSDPIDTGHNLDGACKTSCVAEVVKGEGAS